MSAPGRPPGGGARAPLGGTREAEAAPLSRAWTTAAELRAQVQRRWDRGELLAEAVAPAGRFPWRLALRTPTLAEWSERFDEVRAWAAGLPAVNGLRLVWRERQHRVLGLNRLPEEAWIDSLDDALGLIGQRQAAQDFQAMYAVSRHLPGLMSWLQRQPLRALAVAEDWPRLLAFVDWMQAHPRPGIFLRQVDLPGIHSKYIEAQRGLLGELLDRVLPAEAIDGAATGAAQFAQRYGFRDKPRRVRLRLLDRAAPAWLPGGNHDGDLGMSLEVFARLAPPVRHVFITENEINYLAFPPAPDSLVIFGAGYGVEALAQAAWLQQRQVHYWGDIDTHGFVMLDQLRAALPQVRSFLMDLVTLERHTPQWTSESQPTQRELTHLNPAERRLYDDLRWRRLRDEPIRLEQERLGFGWVEAAVGRVSAEQAPPSA